MKKTVFGLLVAFSAIAMTSCGGGKTPEQIEAEAQKKFDEKKAELEAAASQKCDGSKGAMIQAAVDSMIQVYNADPANAAALIPTTVQ